MKNTSFKIVDSDVLIVNVKTSKWTKLTFDKDQTFSKVIIDSPEVEAHIDFCHLKYDSLEFTQGSKISNVSLAILDYRKLAEVDRVLMNFTDHQLDSSLAFIVEKFVEKGYTIPRTLDPDLGWMWFDPSFANGYYVPSTIGWLIEYKDGTRVDNLEGSITEGENATFIPNKRFRIKGINTSINRTFNIFSSVAGMLGDIYLDKFKSDADIICYHYGWSEGPDPENPENHVVQACSPHRIFIVDSEIGSVIIYNGFTNAEGESCSSGVPDGKFTLPLKPVDAVIVRDTTMGSYMDNGDSPIWGYEQYMINVKGLKDSYNNGMYCSVICNCPDDSNIGTGSYNTHLDKQKYAPIYVLGTSCLNCSDAGIYPSNYPAIENVIDIDQEGNPEACVYLQDSYTSYDDEISRLNTFFFKNKKLSRVSTKHNVYITDCTTRENNDLSVLMDPKTIEDTPKTCYIKNSPVYSIDITSGVNLGLLSVVGDSYLRSIYISDAVTDNSCFYFDEQSCQNIERVEIPGINTKAAIRLLNYINYDNLKYLDIVDVAFDPGTTSLYSLCSKEDVKLYMSGSTGHALQNAEFTGDTLECDASHLSMFSTLACRNVGIKYADTAENSDGDIFIQHTFSPTTRVYTTSRTSGSIILYIDACNGLGLSTTASYKRVDINHYYSNSVSLSNANIDTLKIRNLHSELGLTGITGFNNTKNIEILNQDAPNALSSWPIGGVGKSIVFSTINDNLKDIRASLSYSNTSITDSRYTFATGREATSIPSTEIFVRPDVKFITDADKEASVSVVINSIDNVGCTVDESSCVNGHLETLSKAYKVYANDLQNKSAWGKYSAVTYDGWQGFSAGGRNSTSRAANYYMTIYVKGYTSLPLCCFSTPSTSSPRVYVKIDGVQHGSSKDIKVSHLPDSIATSDITYISLPDDNNLHVVTLWLAMPSYSEGTAYCFVPEDIEVEPF